MRASTSLLALPRASARSSSVSARSIYAASTLTSRSSMHSVSTPIRSSTRTSSSLRVTHRSRLDIGGARTHSSSAASEPLTPIPEISDENSYDIVIIGGANAGLAFACALLSQPTISSTTRILLLEGSSLDKTRNWTGKGEWENRISSLTWENISWLESIGVWKHIEESRSCPVEEMVIWANPSPNSFPTIHFPPLGHPMARMTENMNLQRALLRRIEEVGKGVVDIKEGTRVQEMRLGEGERWVGLRVGEEEWVKGGLVVGADGPNSPVRLFSKIETYGHAYQTHAVVATLNHPPSPLYPNTTAFQRFLPTGPIAFLPLTSEASTMVWSTLPPHAAALKKLSPEALTIMINCGYTLPESTLTALTDEMIRSDQLGHPLTVSQIHDLLSSLPIPQAEGETDQPILPPTISSIHPPSVASFPLRLSHANEYLGKRTALVGDAAHTIHPLAGQGLNQGLADVRCLAQVLENARKLGGDMGSITSLADYPRERYPLNHLILSTTDKLHYIFRARNGLVNWVRGTGLEMINEIGPLKKILMGGAGAQPTVSSDGVSRPRREESTREFGRSDANEEMGRLDGWQMGAASGVEGWFTLKGVGRMVGQVGMGVVREGMTRAVGILERK
ncbi:ubiquinone biosynthesis monooxygenase COQ6 [Kwoniella bestiolae CBS 10118]|uniref:Ubiquinone biosynthesis monooxygenase COQ6, mitochondrial n=1 Tax=Kwoniella bestiolae CBS 10118 TaxID=1296100 RepID=A0A1B9FWF5_9TREE|nr:ubiquinone biosynthesis monooxygenase COQ6 [Kwoniella bestiolae CBS 10118]OCF23099.1 ubiquinone biosynthesis monooxygenase COQ6 [Kwoniella bestiolae CBS 10118]